MMNDSRPDGQARADQAGLCARCRHLQVVTSAKGSRFYLCRLSVVDARFPRYPPIPVVRCGGFAPAGESEARSGG
jgi:hypothetical protein